MGIQGLLPFLKKASRTANIKEFKGCTVAIDTYCWLHRGAFACAEKLALGEKTDQYVYYCMKYINSLLSFGIRPIMVFDGCRLPSKKEVERARRERRDMNRKKAAQLLREGKRSEARDCLAQCIDITPLMALELMNACHEKGVDCIVAPYEADAQLAYLNKIGVAQIVITEDSDLILFGCDKIMFKMDVAGNGILIEQNDLNNALQLPLDVFTFDKFRYICILSGCDYLPSLSGIGLAKALKLFKLSRQNDVKQIIRKMPSILKMSNLIMPDDYVENFIRANNTFLYQLVFDPLKRKLVPLNPYPADVNPDSMDYAGPYISDEEALQIALGNINVNNGDRIADFDPAHYRVKTNSWSQDPVELQAQSIWMPGVNPSKFQKDSTRLSDDIATINRPSTKGKEVTIKGPALKDRVKQTQKRVRQASEDEEEETDSQDLLKLYSGPDQRKDSCERLAIMSLDSSGKPKNIDLAVKRSRVSADAQIREKNVDLNDFCLTDSCNEKSILTEVSNTDKHTFESYNEYAIEEDKSPQITSSVNVVVAGKENSPKKVEQRTCSNAPTHGRNVFAVEGKTSRVSRFSLNAPEHVTVIADVKSRFFTASVPHQETKFFKELRKEHNSNNVEENFELEEIPKDLDDVPEREQEGITNARNALKSDGVSINNPHNNFKFGNLSVFKSHFDNSRAQENASPSIADTSNNPLSRDRNPPILLNNYSTSSSSPNVSQKSNGTVSQDDSDYLLEDPFDNSARETCLDNLKNNKLLGTIGKQPEFPKTGVYKEAAFKHRFSLDLQSITKDETNLAKHVPNDRSCPNFSLDDSMNELPESPLGKSSIVKDPRPAKDCRASGLMKTKTKGRKSVPVTDGCKQSAISQYFQSSFALDKKSISKLVPQL